MSLKFFPNEDRILLEMESLVQRKSNGGIIIPDDAGERLRIGKVVAVGPKSQYEKGDRLLISVHSGINVHMPKYGLVDENLRFYRDAEILARIEEG